MNEQVQRVIDAVKSAAPIMWQAAYRQAYLDGVENILLLIMFATGCFLAFKYAKKCAISAGYADKPDWNEMGPVTLVIVGIVALGLAVIALLFVIDAFGNPTFLAIKELADLAKVNK